MSPEVTVKRKRGRPPKADSLSNKITHTVNINVNTSSSLSSPTAEFNSNMMVRRGAPDIMTPLMKVSPSRPRKRRRGSLASDGSPLSHTMGADHVKTPVSLAQLPYHLRAYDNLATLVQENGVYGSATAMAFTPPPSALSVRSQFQTNYWALPEFNPTPPLNRAHLYAGNTDRSAKMAMNTVSVHRGMVDVSMPSSVIELLPAPPIEQRNRPARAKPFSQNSASSQGHISVNGSAERKRTTVYDEDDSSNDENYMGQADLTVPASLGRAGFSVGFGACGGADDFLLKLMVDESGKAILSDDRSVKPRLGHANSAIGIELFARDSHADLGNVLCPKTPKQAHYLPQALMGLTPNLFYLTPHFNSMMYSVMTPQFTSQPQQLQNFSLQRDFDTVNLADLMGLAPDNDRDAAELHHLAPSSSSTSLSSTSSAASSVVPSNTQPTSNMLRDDSGDARLALRRIIHVKRERGV